MIKILELKSTKTVELGALVAQKMYASLQKAFASSEEAKALFLLQKNSSATPYIISKIENVYMVPELMTFLQELIAFNPITFDPSSNEERIFEFENYIRDVVKIDDDGVCEVYPISKINIKISATPRLIKDGGMIKRFDAEMNVAIDIDFDETKCVMAKYASKEDLIYRSYYS